MRIGPVLVLASFALVLTGCATDDPTPPPSATSTPPSDISTGISAEDAEALREQAARGAFLGALMYIDLEFADDPQRALDQVGTICADIEAGKPEQAVIDNARQRFSSATLALTQDQARRVVEAARTNVC
jgi:hypothetical protein